MAATVISVYDRLGVNSEYLAAFGGIVAAFWALKFLYSLWDGVKAYIFARSLGLSANLTKMGEWAGEWLSTYSITLAGLSLSKVHPPTPL